MLPIDWKAYGRGALRRIMRMLNNAGWRRPAKNLAHLRGEPLQKERSVKGDESDLHNYSLLGIVCPLKEDRKVAI